MMHAPAFDLCQPAPALRAVVGVQAAMAAAVLVAAAPDRWGAAQAAASFAALVATLLWLAGLCATRLVLQRMAAHRRALVAAAWAAACAAGGWACLVALGLTAFSLQALAGAALMAALAAAAFWSWMEQRERLKQPAQDHARLAELQSRIRPHFLFNTLNTALALVRVDPDQAERVIEDLAALFREALAEPGSAVSLAQEIDLARRYLAIEQLRFGDRLRLHWEIDPRAAAARVPPLVLQPLVENAVRHGVEPSPGGGDIRVRASCHPGLVEVEVSNSLPAQPSRPGRGLALANVAERLKLMHDVAAHCEAGPVPGPDGPRFSARLTLPW